MDSAVKPQLFPWYVVGFSLTGLAVTLASFSVRHCSHLGERNDKAACSARESAGLELTVDAST
jgi:hypothetical protein